MLELLDLAITVVKSGRARASRLGIVVTPALLLLIGCATPSAPKTRPVITLDAFDGLQGTVRIVVDRHGIPHVYAGSRADAAFALGWFHARDRLLQMDIYRRAGLGTLAEILGPAAVDEDRFARTLGLHRASVDAWTHLVRVRARRILEAYAAGVNSFIDKSPAALPPFYRENGLEPRPWEPADTFAVHKRFTAELCHSFDDVYLQLVAEKLGRDATLNLFPAERDARVPVVREPVSAEFIMGLRKRSTSMGPEPDQPSSRPVDRGTGPVIPSGAVASDGRVSTLATSCEDILERFGSLQPRICQPGGHASNAWAVNGRLTVDGKPILCCDPHLGLSNPPTFYTAHLVSPELSVIGITIPGIPAVIFGHNNSIAWAGTSAQPDVTDFFVETFDSANPDRYLHRGRWLGVQTFDEEIAVRDHQSVKFQVRRTIHGPIITERGKTLSMSWKGELATTEVVALLAMNAAHDLQSFLDALRSWTAPVIAFVYADVTGRIAVRPSGEIPRRGRGQGRYPVDGAAGNHEWLAPIPFERMPIAIDPPRGYVVAANQRLAPADFPHYMGWQFDPSFRARRIDEVLSSSNRFTPARMRQLQLDSVDLAARVLIPVLLEAFVGEPPHDPIADLSLRLLKAWDFVYSQDTVEGTIAWKWLESFADDVWSDEWKRAALPRTGNWGFCSNGWRPPLDVLVELARTDPGSPWFDDVSTDKLEDLDAIARRSFLAAIHALVEDFGPGISTWNWGRRNRMVIADLQRRPDHALDLGAVPGTIYTVCPGGAGGAVTAGAAYRLVLPLGNLAASRGASPGVQASVLPGQNADGQARRQAAAYLDGSYLPLHNYPFAGSFPAEQVGQLYIMTPRWRADDDDRGD